MSEAGQDDRQIDYASVQAAIEAGVRLCEETRGHDWEQRSGYPHRSCRWCGAFDVVFDLESRTQKRAEAERDELRAALRDLRAYVALIEHGARIHPVTGALMAYRASETQAMLARIDALIGPYGEQGAQSANVSKDVKSIA